MGRLRAVLVALGVAAGCDHPAGLTIEIVAPAKVVHTELLVAQACSGDCPGAVQPPDLPSMPAQLFVADDSRRWVSTREEGLGFRLTSEVDTTLSRIVAVGYDQEGAAIAASVLTDVPIPSSEAVWWRVVLTPSTPVEMTPAPAGELRVTPWTVQDPSIASCLVVERNHDGRLDRFAIGPSIDTDCDDVAAPECAPWAHRVDAPQPPNIDAASCTTRIDLGGGQACLVGGTACSETAPSAGTCAPVAETYCLGAPLCDCAQWDPTCLDTALRGGYDSMSRVTCYIPVDDEGGACPTGPTRMDVNFGELVSGSPVTCDSVELSRLGPSVGPFGSSVAVEGGTFSITLANGCAVELTWSGQASASQSRSLVLATLHLSNGKHILAPVALDFDPGLCGAATPRCTPETVVADATRVCAPLTL